jgi:hypothetical protein
VQCLYKKLVNMDVMIDLETLGDTPDAPVLEIAAVAFDRSTFHISKSFDIITTVAFLVEQWFNRMCKDFCSRAPCCTLPQPDLEKNLGHPCIEETGTAGILRCTSNDIKAEVLKAFPGASLETLEWWQTAYKGHKCWSQSTHGLTQIEAVRLFHHWLDLTVSTYSYVYCKGMFDIPILSYWFRKYSLTPPWFFPNERDLRTIIKEHPEKSLPPPPEEAHDALVDCEYQVQILKEIRSTL